MEVKRNRKLSLKDILDEIDPSEIESFVQQYAKHDKTFEVILKAHFISRFVAEDQDQKYARILSEIIRPKTLSNPKLTASARKSAIIVLEDFTFQSADLLSIEDYKEAFYIIKNSLDKISYLQNTYLFKTAAVEKFRLNFLKGLRVIFDQDLAPKFRADMEALLISNVKKSYYLPSTDNLISLLDTYNVFSEKDKKDLINDLIPKIDKAADAQPIIMTVIQLAVPFSSLANSILKKITHEQIFKGLSSFILERKFDVVEFFLENKKVEYDLHVTALNCMLHHQKSDYKALTVTLQSLTIQNTGIPIIRDIIDHLSGSYLRQDYKALEKWIASLPFSLQCTILAKAEHYEKLGAILKEKNDIEWVSVYDQKLIEEGFKPMVKDLYLNCAINYLENHIGSRSTQYVEKISQRLNLISEKSMLQEIQEALYEQFSHRISIQ